MHITHFISSLRKRHLPFTTLLPSNPSEWAKPDTEQGNIVNYYWVGAFYLSFARSPWSKGIGIMVWFRWPHISHPEGGSMDIRYVNTLLVSVNRRSFSTCLLVSNTQWWEKEWETKREKMSKPITVNESVQKMGMKIENTNTLIFFILLTNKEKKKKKWTLCIWAWPSRNGPGANEVWTTRVTWACSASTLLN